MKKRLLFIIWSFSFGGGAEKILSTLIRNIDKEKYEIDVLEFYHTDIKLEEIGESITLLPPVIDMTRHSRTYSRMMNVLVYLFPSCIRKKYSSNYDIEIAFNYLIPTFLLNKKNRCFSWVHTDVTDLKRNKFLRYKQRKSWEFVEKIVSISNNTEQSILEIFPEFKNKVYKIYNGYEFEKILTMGNEQTDIVLKANSLLFIGRFEERKDPLACIKLLKYLHNNKHKHHLYYMGFGKLENKIFDLAKDYNLQDYVHVIAYQKNPYPIIKQCQSIILLSICEGFPTVLVEGLALGKPFISTRVGGAEELVNNGKCGCIVENGEYEMASDFLKKNFDEVEKVCRQHAQRYSAAEQYIQFEQMIESEV